MSLGGQDFFFSFNFVHTFELKYLKAGADL